MGSLYKIYMVLLINITIMPKRANFSTTHINATHINASALEGFMNRPDDFSSSVVPTDDFSSSVVPTDDIPAVVGPPRFDVPSSKIPTLFAQPAFPQPTYGTVFPTSPILTPPKCGSTVQLESSHVHPEPSLPKRVRTTVFDLLLRPIKVISFCLAFVGLGFPQSAVSAILKRLNLTCEKNGNSMVDIKAMNENLDQFVRSLVQMKEIVDFIVAVITALNKKPIFWTMFRNPSSLDYIKTTLPKDVLQSVRKCLTILGFSEGNQLMNVPSTLASLSESQLLEQIWTVVSNYDWESAPQKPSKRGREEEQPDDAPSAKREPLSYEQRMKCVLTQIMKALLSGVSRVSLHEIFQSGFLDLSKDHLRQVMDFLSNPDNLWCLHRILMEMKNLNVSFEGDDVFSSRGDDFNFSEFNPQQMTILFNRLFLEAIMMRQTAYQELHEKEVQREQERRRIERFIKALWTLWKTNDINSFFQELIAVCPEFNSYRTNWSLLEVVVDEFRHSIYNATTRAYHNRDHCVNPLQVFLEYSTIQGVFSPKALIRENIRICEYSSNSCPFGPTCSGAHQCFVSLGWRKGSVWGTCCPEYAERRTCRNPNCRDAHFTGDEFNRAFRNGGKDSNKMRNSLLAQAYIAKRQRTAE